MNKSTDEFLPSCAQILSEVCQEREINLRWLSNGWLAMLEKGGEKRYVMGHKFGVNAATPAMIADDKFATYEVLKAGNVPVIEHRLLYDENNPTPYARNYQSKPYVEQFFRENGNHIVIKPTNGYCGENVYQVASMEEVSPILEKIFHHSCSAVMCPFYEILNEYRLIMLDGEVRLAYKKVRGEDWRFNLGQGARAERIEDVKLYEKLQKIARAATTALGLRFCSVDIIETDQHELLVMEINSGVMTGNYLRQHPEEYPQVKQFYADVVERMFAEN